MPLSWNEIKSRALTFSRTWADAKNEKSEAKPFWIDFFEIFGITNKRVASFEHAVKKLPGHDAKFDGYIDLFWPGMLLVEHKSRGKDLNKALTQAMDYFPGIAERVAYLFGLYQKYTSLLPVDKPKAKRRAKSPSA